ncbi:MAG: GGDEF domain-containing protein [Dictyoglomus sp.]|uniref:GGDEF domain-containing protein n=1 Tax=Dictyoglomus sp. TaxID=28205 RepID=UPI003D0D6F8C
MNQTYEKDVYKYPDNEIRSIAKEIEGITEKEMYKKNLELSNLNKKLEELSIKDDLTGLYNRRKMDQELEKCLYIWERYNRPFSIIIIDIDDFKKINDTYGHLIGDMVLEKISKIIRENIRKSDIASRWGGEEFLILLPETNLQNATLVAEAFRRKIEEANFGIDEKITVSVGVANIENNESIDSLIQRADKNLYKAKEYGKNKVVF